MKLSDLKCKNAKYNPSGKGNKLFDGGGLFLHVKESGKKYWHFKYRFLDKEKLLSFGVYDQVKLQEARDMREQAKKLLTNMKDPGEVKKLRKLELLSDYENNFENIARDWHKQNTHMWKPEHAENIMKRFEANIFPIIGARPIKAVTAQELLKAVEKVQARGNHDLAHRMMQMCGKVFRFAIARGLCDKDITTDLKGALKPVKSKNRIYLSEKQLPDFLKKLEKYDSEFSGSLLVKLAFKFLILTFVRSSEIRGAKWEEIDFDKAQWRIPAVRMKMKTDHIVPLCKQSLKILSQIKELTGSNAFGLVFPSYKEPNKTISENTFMRAIEVLGYKNIATAHGFRSTASTILNENGYYPDVIERQLAHLERNQVRAAYNHAEYLKERTQMMQWWGDKLEEYINGKFS